MIIGFFDDLVVAATERFFDSSDTLRVTVIIDKHGNIVSRIEGIVFDDEFETKIRPFLQ